MTHYLGPVVPDGRTLNQVTGLDFVPRPGSLGGPRFVILHFDNVSLSGNARLTVETAFYIGFSGTSKNRAISEPKALR